MNYDAISPIDGRYSAESRPLAAYFSERAFAEERMRVELAYLSFLVELGVAPNLEVPDFPFSMPRVKALERSTGHDVKAVELFVRESLRKKGATRLAPFVHLGLTSEDTNSLAFARLLSASLAKVIVPSYSHLAMDLAKIAGDEAKTPMVARTHGRPAVPTTFGKEMAVFAVRIAERVSSMKSLRPMAKFSGAVGTYASFAMMGRRDWPDLLARFVAGSGVDYARYSSQVVPGERLSDILHSVASTNQLILSLCRDLWLYQTLDYVHFARPGKVSSSTMPQKVNPVDLENAEGQVEVSNALLNLLAYRLQVTRLQRDLSDSVLRRMVGQALAHSLIACGRVRSSLRSMTVERSKMKKDLAEHPEVYAEALQISMRLSGDERGYEKVKRLIEAGRFPRLPSDFAGSRGYLGFAPKQASECRRTVENILRQRSADGP